MKNIKPNDLNSIISNYVKDISDDENKKEFTRVLEEKAKEMEKEIRIEKYKECIGYLNSCYIYINKYLIPRVDSSSYEYRELKDIISNLRVSAETINKLIENENTLNLIVDREK